MAKYVNGFLRTPTVWHGHKDCQQMEAPRAVTNTAGMRACVACAGGHAGRLNPRLHIVRVGYEQRPCLGCLRLGYDACEAQRRSTGRRLKPATLA